LPGLPGLLLILAIPAKLAGGSASVPVDAKNLPE
jgi:hypothetical protein